MPARFKFATLVLLVSLEKFIMDEKKYTLKVEWFDEVASVLKPFTLFYYPRDSSVEMFDIRHRRTFLKRTPSGDISETDLYVGNTVRILGRDLKILAFLDEATEKALQYKAERTYAMIKPDAISKMGRILSMIEERKFKVNQLLMTKFSPSTASAFYQEHTGRPFFDTLIEYISSGPVVALELAAESAVKGWRDTLGPTDSAMAREVAPDSVRARFGTDKTHNAAHGSDSAESALRELELVFGQMPAYWKPSENSTLCLIKPHIVHEGRLGEVITFIQDNGFSISGLKMTRLSSVDAEKFFEAYNGVWKDYGAQIKQFTSGPCVTVAVSSPVEIFREFVGPFDPEVGRQLRPNSVRAHFGRDTVFNAVHCTDLPSDGPMEVEFFFGSGH